MQNTRLIALFRTLSNKEIRELRKFLASSFFNKRPEVSYLFEYLVESLTIYKIIPSKKKAFQFVNAQKGSDSAYDDQLIRLWMSFLFKLTEKYLVHRSFFENEVKVKTKLAFIYRSRNLPKHLERNIQEVKLLQEKHPFRNAEFYSDNFQIQLEQYHFLSSNKRMSELNLQKLSDNLDLFYLVQKLRQSCLALAHQTVYKIEYEFGLLDKILQYVEGQDLLKVDAIGLYYFVYQFLTQPTQGIFFQKYKERLVKVTDKFPKEELGDLYILGINFCIKRYNEGNHEYLKDELDLYQAGLQQDLFLKDNMLSRFSYRNVVTLSLVLEEFEWVENFIYEYKNRLAKPYRKSMFSFNLARLEYSRRNYKAALQLLNESSYKDLLLNLAAKTVVLKIYYELDEFDLLDAHILLHFCKKRMEANPYNKNELADLKSEIVATKAIAEKGWLLEQY